MKAAFKPLRNYPGIVLRGFLALLLVCPATPLLSDEQTAVTSTRDAAINQRRHGFNRTVGADRIVGVVALHRVVGEREIAGRARHGSDVIEARNKREGASTGEAAIGRLETEDAAE